MIPTREEAWRLITEHTSSQSLLHHMLAVEAAMRAYAAKWGEDQDYWGLAGLVHDVDYEEHPELSPEGHPCVGARLLRDLGWPDDIVRAVLAHGGEHTGVRPESRMEKTLVAADELTGFLAAVALVRPTKDIRDVREVSSVRKKWKDRAFAAAVSRSEIEHACEALDVDLWTEHVPTVLGAMQAIAAELGLAGQAVEPRE